MRTKANAFARRINFGRCWPVLNLKARENAGWKVRKEVTVIKWVDLILVDNARGVFLLKSTGIGLILLLILSTTSVMLAVLTIYGHRHVPLPASTNNIT